MKEEIWAALVKEGIPVNRFVERWAEEAIELVKDGTVKNVDDIDDALLDIEPDVYTSDLLEWLGASEGNMAYLDEELQTFKPEKGFEALQGAQRIAMIDVYLVVLQTLVEG